MSKALLTTTALLFAFVFYASGQAVIGVVEYLQAEDQEEFLEIEKEWHSIYKELIETEDIYGCSVFQVPYNTNDKQYNIVKILWFDSFSKINFRSGFDSYQAAYPNKDKDDWKDLQNRTKDSYEVVSSGVFQQQLSCSNGLDKQGKIYRINEIQIKPGKNKKYIQMMQEIYLPVYIEDVKNNKRTVWSLWAKWTGETDTFEYTTADGYTDLKQIEKDDFTEYFKNIHPDMEMNEISKEIEEMRTLVNSEMWKLIYRILK